MTSFNLVLLETLKKGPAAERRSGGGGWYSERARSSTAPRYDARPCGWI
jgi:hypothetical protein